MNAARKQFAYLLCNKSWPSTAGWPVLLHSVMLKQLRQQGHLQFDFMEEKKNVGDFYGHKFVFWKVGCWTVEQFTVISFTVPDDESGFDCSAREISVVYNMFEIWKSPSAEAATNRRFFKAPFVLFISPEHFRYWSVFVFFSSRPAVKVLSQQLLSHPSVLKL